jgi:hypothetical protein
MHRVYVVLMRRWGDTETHSYIYGVYSGLEDAIDHAVAAEDERGGKYVAYIEERPVNPSDSDRPKLYHTGKFPDFPREAVVWQHADLVRRKNGEINTI